MVGWICLILSVMGSPYGANTLRETSSFRSTTPIYSCIFFFHRTYAILCRWSKFALPTHPLFPSFLFSLPPSTPFSSRTYVQRRPSRAPRHIPKISSDVISRLVFVFLFTRINKHSFSCLAFQLQSTLLTLISSVFQLVALLWYLISYFPMGSSGLRLVARVGGGRVAAWMND